MSVRRKLASPCAGMAYSLCSHSQLFVHRIFEQAPQSPDPVLPADLLTFVVSSPRVADAYPVDPHFALRELDSDFRLKGEAVFQPNAKNTRCGAVCRS